MAVAFKDAYKAMDEKFDEKTYLMSANTLTTWPGDIDASRLYMDTAETRQSLTLLDDGKDIHPDVPRLQTSWENPLGRLNKNQTYFQLDGTWEVLDVIRKFSNGDIYTIVFFNHDTQTYEMIENEVAEDLVEKLGFMYNYERFTQLKPGDVITDEILYKSTAYDKNMNYRYGKNAKVMYSTSTDTFEDAIPIRKGWIDSVKSIEVDTVSASVNNNTIPLNLYGTDKEYKTFPDIGEPVQDSTVFGLRLINKKHLLIDFQNDALRKLNSTDTDFVIAEAESSSIYDINIYYNGDDPFPDNVFFHQLKTYYDQICEYARRITEWTVKIKESGKNYTQNIPALKSWYQYYNNPEYKWCGKEKNKPFGYMVVDFKIKSIIGINPGSKMAGRFGKI